MYILYNLISYATGACLGSHSIGWPTLSNTSQAAQRRCTTSPEGIETFRALLCSAVRSSSSVRSPFRCSASSCSAVCLSAHALRVDLRVGGPLPSASARSSALSACSPAPALPVGIVFVPVSALRSLCHPCPGSSAVCRVSCPTLANVRSDYATTVR